MVLNNAAEEPLAGQKGNAVENAARDEAPVPLELVRHRLTSGRIRPPQARGRLRREQGASREGDQAARPAIPILRKATARC